MTDFWQIALAFWIGTTFGGLGLIGSLSLVRAGAREDRYEA